jgi:hypothetical protein
VNRRKARATRRSGQNHNQPGDGFKRKGISIMAEHKMTKNQLNARRIEAVYQAMDADRANAISNRIRDIACDFELTLEPAMDEAADEVEEHFDKLIADGFTVDEVEAIIRHQKGESRETYA